MEFFSLTKAGKNWNEDRLFACNDFAFVLDGATSLTKQKFSSLNSDAEWCSHWWKEYLSQSMSDLTKPLPDIVREGIKKSVKEFKRLAKNKEIIDFPSTTLAAIRRINGKLELYILGDSSILVKTKTGYCFQINEARVDVIDKTNITILLDKAKKEKISLAECRQLHPEPVLEGRMRKNSVYGYSILSDKHTAADDAIYTFIDESLIDKVIILSDGFSQVYDTVKFMTYTQLLNKVNSLKDAEKVYAKLFSLQQKDKLCYKYPRLKLRDDASLVHIKF